MRDAPILLFWEGLRHFKEVLIFHRHGITLSDIIPCALSHRAKVAHGRHRVHEVHGQVRRVIHLISLVRNIMPPSLHRAPCRLPRPDPVLLTIKALGTIYINILGRIIHLLLLVVLLQLPLHPAVQQTLLVALADGWSE